LTRENIMHVLVGTLVVWLLVMGALHLLRPFRRAVGSGLLLVLTLIGVAVLVSLAGLR
jgi:hypothetical protein